MAVSHHGKRAVEWRIGLIDTPAMREAIQALQAALEKAARDLAVKTFRRRSALRLRAARLARLQAELPGESTGPPQTPLALVPTTWQGIHMKTPQPQLGSMDEILTAPARAAEFFAERFGENRKTLGRRQAIEFVRRGWGVAPYATVAEIELAFDAAIGAEVKVSHTATFAAAYNYAPGHSAGGSSMGTRPVSCPMFTAESVRAWAEYTFYRFAISDVDRGY
jgi:hypothetical protein